MNVCGYVLLRKKMVVYFVIGIIVQKSVFLFILIKMFIFDFSSLTAV